MDMKKFLIAPAFALAVLLSPSSSTATTIFFGEDLGLGEATPLPIPGGIPNSLAAQSAFLGSLIGAGVETFEGFAAGTPAPLVANFGAAGTATLNGNGNIANVAPGSTNGFGRYAVSGSQYWESTDVFSIVFSAPVAAFGFFGVDIGDFNGQVTLTLAGGGAQVLNIGNSTGISGGSVLYYGVIEPLTFTSITFGNTAAGVDFFAFDDMTIGSLEQICPPGATCPEPASMALLGIGLAGMGFARRRKAA